MSNWPAQRLQFVWFSPDTKDVKASPIYLGLTGQDPDSSSESRVATPATPNLSQAAGDKDGLHHEVTVQPGRVDYHITLTATEESDDPFQLFENVTDVAIEAGQRAAQISSIPIVNRIAFVSTLARPASGREAANELVRRSLGNIALPQNATDVSFQVNGPIFVEDMTVNRLVRFAAQGIARMMVTLTPGTATGVPITDERFAATFMIDLNTAPALQPISDLTKRALWAYFLRESRRIREVGTLGALT